MVHVTFVSSIYEIFDGCETVQKKKLSFVTNENRIQLKTLESYSHYSVKIESRSEYGISDPSRKHTFTTGSSEASPPRSFSIKFQPNNKSELLVSGTLLWSPPCHPNGRIEFYTIKLKGHREGFSEHLRTEVSFERNFTFIDLKRGFDYEVEVKAKNAEFYGEARKFIFKAPAGSEFQASSRLVVIYFCSLLVPLQKDLLDWTLPTADDKNFELGKGEIFIRRGTFFSEAGEITGIAFLLFLAVSLNLSLNFLELKFLSLRIVHQVIFPSQQVVIFHSQTFH